MTPLITHVFFDIGGVLATNGWDRESRKAAVRKFGLDEDEFASRHEAMAGSLDEGAITLSEYVKFAVFHKPRTFSEKDFIDFMYAESKPFPESIEIARAVAEGCTYWVMTLNNECEELNEYRIRKFGLDAIFDAFLSSCWLRLRKPTAGFYMRALNIAQANPRTSVFIDDREQNIVPARDLGMHVIHYQSAAQLSTDLTNLGIKFNLKDS
ncbi:MAG TPA: HAD-IA family hydrolase [Gemmatimonadaceae bacterium]|nr:HAD-IA family hydrolase [Gemmatimonadaceae bacterium]